jgi:hypothetical protein
VTLLPCMNIALIQLTPQGSGPWQLPYAHPQTRGRRVRGDQPAMETWTLQEQDATAPTTDCDGAVEDGLAAA